MKAQSEGKSANGGAVFFAAYVARAVLAGSIGHEIARIPRVANFTSEPSLGIQATILCWSKGKAFRTFAISAAMSSSATGVSRISGICDGMRLATS